LGVTEPSVVVGRGGRPTHQVLIGIHGFAREIFTRRSCYCGAVRPPWACSRTWVASWRAKVYPIHRRGRLASMSCGQAWRSLAHAVTHHTSSGGYDGVGI
jgi:hypothetical protein